MVEARVLAVSTDLGADAEPAWWLNLQAHPDVTSTPLS